ncbi:proline-rich protein 36-like [Ctenopharyngodon idella]|uniref:proline-rich protein 36-like n=1 Tax=Ctenopharyngodon idella TaxID=7959 RepID=UPI002230D627|nr:proline-rich protein 36-like [Ctenopharyngodon idella]
MYTPAFLLLCLEQKDRSLEEHLDNFLLLAPLTHYPDSSLQEPATSGMTERNIGTETEPSVSDQVCEFAVTIAEGDSVEDEGLEGSPAHTPATESEFQASTMDCYDFVEDSLPQLIPPETIISILDEMVPPSLPLPPPLQNPDNDFVCSSPSTIQPVLQPTTLPATQPSLSHIMPSALHQPPLSGVATPGACCEPASGDEDSAAPPLASGHVVTPRLIVLTPPPLLLPPSSTAVTIERSAPLDSLGPATPPGSDIAITSPRTYGSFEFLRPSTPTAPMGTAFPQTPPRPSVVPAPPQPSGTLLLPRGVVAATPSRTSRPSASLRSFGSLSSPQDPSTSAALLPRLPKVVWSDSPPRLLPPATPPWVAVLAVAWSNIWTPLLKATHWISPPSAPPWTPALRLLPVSHPPPEPPPTPSSASHLHLPLSTARGRAFPGGGDMLHVHSVLDSFWTCCCSISRH